MMIMKVQYRNDAFEKKVTTKKVRRTHTKFEKILFKKKMLKNDKDALKKRYIKLFY